MTDSDFHYEKDGSEYHCSNDECDFWVPAGMEYISENHDCEEWDVVDERMQDFDVDDTDVMDPEEFYEKYDLDGDEEDYEEERIKLIDTTEKVPQIKDTRVSVLDVVAIINSPHQGEQEVFDYWNLSEEQVNAAIEYYKSHKAKLDQLREEIKQSEGSSQHEEGVVEGVDIEDELEDVIDAEDVEESIEEEETNED